MKSIRNRSRTAFTLVETLLASALLALLLTAAATVAWQVVSLWGAQADDPLFDRHCDGLERFLRVSVTGRVFPTESFDTRSDTPAIRLEPPSDIPWFAAVSGRGGVVRGILDFTQDSGLRFLWRRAGADPTEAPCLAVLSAQVTGILVVAYDEASDKWQVERRDTSRSIGERPRMLRVSLEHRGLSRTLWIELPGESTMRTALRPPPFVPGSSARPPASVP